MKRLFILIFIIALMLDLSGYRHLGKDKFVPPESPVQSLKTSADLVSGAEPVCHHGLPIAEVQHFILLSFAQPIKFVVQHPRKTFVSPHFSSTGGLPGELASPAFPFRRLCPYRLTRSSGFPGSRLMLCGEVIAFSKAKFATYVIVNHFSLNPK
jgi:hypothetical protein